MLFKFKLIQNLEKKQSIQLIKFTVQVFAQKYKIIKQNNQIYDIVSNFTSCSKFIENLYDSIKMHLFFLGH